MLISHDHKIIFIHCPKVMGTSVTDVLLKKGFKQIYEKHSKINVIKNDFKNYKAFGIIRNPFDWLASCYWYNQTKNRRLYSGEFHLPFNEWVEYVISGKSTCSGGQLSWFRHKKRNADEILKMEDINKVINVFGISFKVKHLNKGIRRQKDYRQYFNTITRDTILEYLKNEISEFNYTF